MVVTTVLGAFVAATQCNWPKWQVAAVFALIIPVFRLAPPRPVDLAALTEDLVSVFRSAFERAGIELITAIEPVGMRDVDVDMWEPTVVNLVSNALKYTPGGSVRVALRSRGDVVELLVADTGIGIAREEQERVFERFFRSSNEAAR